MRETITSFIDTHAEEQLDFVVTLAHQNSYFDYKEGVDRIGGLILGTIGDLLPIHEVVRQEHFGDHHILRSRHSSKAIYLLGHMDTVFPPDHAFQKCRTRGDTLTGPGVGDMKGGLAVFVYALKALAKVGFLDELSLALILGSDEESGSVTSHPIYLKERENAVACLVAECAGSQGEVVVSRNGKLGARIDSFGRDRHVGELTHQKSSAILEMAEKIIAVESLNALLPGVSINVGRVEGGLGPCTVAAHAGCLIDVRWSEEWQKEIIQKRLNEEVSRAVGHDRRSEITVLNSRPAMPLLEETLRLFDLLQEAGRRLGLEVGREHRRGTSDANFFGAAGVPTIDGLGPVCHNDHTQDEHIVISSLKERSALVAHFLLDYGISTGAAM